MTLLYKIIGFCALFLLINNLCLGKIESRLRVGKTINVFVRYGYLGISMKVISYNDTERWLFKEPTYNVFRVSYSQLSFLLFLLCILFFVYIELNFRLNESILLINSLSANDNYLTINHTDVMKS